MTEARREAFRMLLSSTTESPVDRQRALIAFQACQTPHEMQLVKAAYLQKRYEWLGWLSSTQRRWQSTVSKNPTKGNHHDSWATREAYLRCKGSYHDYMAEAHRRGVTPYGVQSATSST